MNARFQRLQERLGQRWQQLFAAQSARNFSFLLGGEGIGRVIRVMATIAMARALDVSDFGLLAVALTCHEFIAVLAHNGFGLYLLKQQDKHYLRAANTVWILSWLWAGGMVLLQGILAFSMWHLLAAEAAQYVAALAPIHLLLPLAITHVYLIQRHGALGAFAGVTLGQNVVDCVTTIALLLLGFGIWSIVIAKALSTLIWAIGIRAASDWQFSREHGFSHPRQAFRYTAPVLFSEYGKSIRQWGDNLLVGSTLGAEMLGLYYFAKNSGLGISLSLSQVSVTVATPRFAEITRSSASADEKRTARKRLTVNLSLCVSLLIVAQAAFAPWYVPLLFGQTWSAAVPILAILCLSALPRCIAELHACLARNSHLTGLEATWNAGYTAAFLMVVAIASNYGLHSLAWATVALNIACALWLADRTWRQLEPTSNANEPITESL